jgi:hypothetical protein
MKQHFSAAAAKTYNGFAVSRRRGLLFDGAPAVTAVVLAAAVLGAVAGYSAAFVNGAPRAGQIEPTPAARAAAGPIASKDRGGGGVAAMILPASRTDDVDENIGSPRDAAKPATHKHARSAPRAAHAHKASSPPSLAAADCDPAQGAGCSPDDQSLSHRLDQALDRAFPPDTHDPALDPPY